MGFGYIGYIWSLVGCFSFLLFYVVLTVGLSYLGRRMEKKATTRIVSRTVMANDRSVLSNDAEMQQTEHETES